jgi:hypothetical protein
VRLDREVLELLGSEPELLAIADAIAETQGDASQALGSTTRTARPSGRDTPGLPGLATPSQLAVVDFVAVALLSPARERQTG